MTAPDQDQALRALAYVLHAVRPDWNTQGILATLRRDNRPLLELAAVAVCAAGDDEAHTPGVISTRDAVGRVRPRQPDSTPMPPPVREVLAEVFARRGEAP